MKVLLVSALPPPFGGIAEWTKQYLEYCKTNSIEVDLVNISLSGSRGTKINDRTSIKDEVVRTRRVLKDMNLHLDKTNPNVVHMNTSCGPFGIIRDMLCVKAAKKRSVPVVLHFHCNVESRENGFLWRMALKKMTRMACQILVLNKKSKKYIEQYSITEPIVIPNFINGDFSAASHVIHDTVKEILFVGHVQETKGCKEIIKAAESFPEIHFTLVGPVAKEISILPCPENVSMIGEVDHNEIKDYLMKSDVYLFPSYAEGFSLSLTEAMSTGLPIIASDAGANQDMIEDMGGIIIPIKSSEAIVNAINEIMDPEVRRKMSIWSIDKVNENYLIDKVMHRLLSIYKSVLKSA